MKTVEIRFVRDGGDLSVLEETRRYQVTYGNSKHTQLAMPLSFQDFIGYLPYLRYDDGDEALRQDKLKELSETVTSIIKLPEQLERDSPLHLELVTSCKELWVLPFEATLGLDGNPLFTRRDQDIVLTRRIPTDEIAPHRFRWPARPRMLFVHASPAWFGGPAVPAHDHKQALLEVLRPWFGPIDDPNMVVGDAETVLTELPNATLQDIHTACQQAADEDRPYTHVHILAHGGEIQAGLETHYGIALASSEEKLTEAESIASAIKPDLQPQMQGYEVPVVVSLGTCDSANVDRSYLAVNSLTQALHLSGVPVVIASQLPLTFSGSSIVAREFYKQWFAGRDVRDALHETRVALAEAEDAGHDWVSLVAYLRLPQGYDEYLFEVQLQSQLAALETTSNHAKNLLEKEINEPWQFDLVTDSLKDRIETLTSLLGENKQGPISSRELYQENTGLLGSAHKRLAELFFNRAMSDEAQKPEWLEQSRKSLRQAGDIYREGFDQNASHHWSGVQYLAISAVLTGTIDLKPWYACLFAAESSVQNAGSESERIWALGSLAELILLAPLAGESNADDNAAEAVDELRKRTNQNRNLFPDLSPITSTRRQFQRYVDWWTKANGFFAHRESDLSREAKMLVDRV